SSFLVSINHIVLLFVSVVLFSILLRVRERLYDTEKAKTRVELITLRDQINPHFLFNVLNNIYSQAIQDDSEKTASSIVKLSKMMRYVVHQARDEYVPLAKELEYLDNYIDLQRERLDRSVEVSYLKELDDPIDLRIAPLLLIPFVENAFKHGISTDEASSIVIEITLKGRLFSMLIRNRKVTGKLAPHEVSGRGIEATKERLLFLYPDKHQLILESLPDQFVVNLQIQLDAKSDSDR
ncbi:MAG: sensor histidine kinase, partial [Lewinella sp.]|nr:sensor histidine kinase [Lewinella sp.]